MSGISPVLTIVLLAGPSRRVEGNFRGNHNNEEVYAALRLGQPDPFILPIMITSGACRKPIAESCLKCSVLKVNRPVYHGSPCLKEENYRACFHQFDPVRIAAMQEEEVERLLQNTGIIRHRGKIQAIISNARARLAMEQNGESFADFVWSFVDGQPQITQWPAR